SLGGQTDVIDTTASTINGQAVAGREIDQGPGNPRLLVLAFSDISISGLVTIKGSRALALVSTSGVVVSGGILLNGGASGGPGAASGHAADGGTQTFTSNNELGGGGAGGSNGAVGGNGGRGGTLSSGCGSG